MPETTSPLSAARLRNRVDSLSGRSVALIWLASKALLVGIWVAVAPGVQGDMRYFWKSLHDMTTVGPEKTLVEYPTPMIWLLSFPKVFFPHYQFGYIITFIVAMIVLDAGYTYALWRVGSRRGERHTRPALGWIAFSLLMGPTAFMRFDLIPAVLVGAAVLQLVQAKGGWAGILVACGAASKVWPVALLLALVGDKKKRWWALAGCLGTGILLAIASVLFAGWERLFSPLTWQRDRGLQVESLWATIPMIQRLFDHRFVVAKSQYNAFEITGPGTSIWLSAASLSTVAGFVAILVITVWWLRSPQREDTTSAGLLMVFITGIMVVTSKTFSPQYLLWLAAPIFAVQLASDSPKLRTIVHWLLWITAGTQVVYPIAYSKLVHRVEPLTYPLTAILAARNVAIVVLLWWVTRAFLTRRAHCNEGVCECPTVAG